MLGDMNQVNHLLLLVGGNPLPGAVAALTLVEAGGRVTLIHSNKSQYAIDLGGGSSRPGH